MSNKSDCCGYPVKVAGDDKEGTHYYTCTNPTCLKPCGVKSKPEETPANQQPENALTKALNTIDKLPVGKFIETQPDASPDQTDSEKLLTADEVSTATTWKIDWVKSRMRLINRILRSQRDMTYPLAFEAGRKEQAEKDRAEIVILEKALKDDASDLWKVTNGIKEELTARDWIMEGRGSYAWDDDRYKDETRHAFEAVMKLIETIQHPAQLRFHEVMKGRLEQALAEAEKRGARELAKWIENNLAGGTENYIGIDGRKWQAKLKSLEER